MIMLLIFSIPQSSFSKEGGFGLNWQFAVDLPQAGVVGVLKGYIEHLKGSKFKFNGEYLNRKGPINSGPIKLSTNFDLDSGLLRLNSFNLTINNLKTDLPQLGLSNPDLSITGKGILDPVSVAADFKDLQIKAGNLPDLTGRLTYTPARDGSCLLEISNPLPLLEQIVEINFPDFEKWDKEGNFSLKIALRKINSAPEASLKLDFSEISAASADGLALVDSVVGNIEATSLLNNPQPTLNITFQSGEALYDTFYVNITKHPLNAEIKSTLPDKFGKIKLKTHIDWKGMGNIKADAQLKDIFHSPAFSGNVEYKTDELSAPFKAFAIDPFSLEGLSGNGKFALRCAFNGTKPKTHLRGEMDFENCTVSKDETVFKGINADLPFVLSLNEKLLPQADDTLPYSPAGIISFDEIKSGQLEIKDFAFPISVSSNSIEFGTVPTINLEGGTLNLSDLKIRHPFNDDFALNGKIVTNDINLLPLSPQSLPIDGQLSGDLKFWLLKDHLSTSGKLYGNVYGGEMTIDEIFAENPFEDSRQYGADFNVKHLDLEPLSKALDIGRITGRMDLDLNELVIAYEQPASFHLVARTTPGSGKSGDISLKAVNTLSVIGTGSGLTGAGVGVFSQFFKEFGYAGLGLECTLNDDIFKIRGLIRDDGIEYIIKRPPLFGINVINSNPENLISFSDMLKRLKRVIGN
ncbi:hypothetical protein Desal_3128 [Maridesulfovibrio salexigens DSM 2638]|uniref:Dicarboxylate transport domain-containing protein n=2 Tax=Maridesulfovibrio salexigens TaxID=880 RepID=C6C1K4_MARSD|nr:hypothetical protein Desal_3128 [Maridesulfovibrio salexigens DSM 2638]